MVPLKPMDGFNFSTMCEGQIQLLPLRPNDSFSFCHKGRRTVCSPDEMIKIFFILPVLIMLHMIPVQRQIPGKTTLHEQSLQVRVIASH